MVTFKRVDTSLKTRITSSYIVIVLLLLLATPTHGYKQPTCLSSEYYPDKYYTFSQNYTGTQAAPLRICLDPTNIYLGDSKTCFSTGQSVIIWGTSYTCEASDLVTANKKALIMDHTLSAISWLESLLLVQQAVKGNISFTFNATHKCGYDGGVEMIQPRNLTSYECDIILLLTSWPMRLKSGTEEVAGSVICAEDQQGRPIVGQLNIDPKFVTDTIQLQYTEVAAITHQIIHILGFSTQKLVDINALYNASTGKPFLESVNNSLLVYKNTTYVVSDSVKSYAREHFDCPTLLGAELENTGIESPAALDAHWSQRIFDDEIMAASLVMKPRLTLATLAMLKDTGWYDYSFNETAEHPYYSGYNNSYFGYKRGCGFCLDYCKTWDDTWEYLGKDHLETEYCLFDRKSKGVLELANYSVVNNVTANHMPALFETTNNTCLPIQFQVFDSVDCHLGGTDVLAEACPIVESDITSYCSVAENDQGSGYLYGEVYGDPGGRCFYSSLVAKEYVPLSKHHPRCYLTRCAADGRLEVKIGAFWLQCPVGGGSIVNPQYFIGELVCPSEEIICLQCESNCGPNGVCEDGVCICNDGWSGKECDQYATPLRLTNVFPKSGPVSGNTTIILSGMGFVEGNSSMGGILVSFGGVFVNGTYVNATVVEAKTPMILSANPSLVTVTMYINGVQYENSVTFQYYFEPSVSAIVPDGAAEGSVAIAALIGSNFTSTNDIRVFIGGESVEGYYVRDTLIMFLTPSFAVPGQSLSISLSLNGQDFVNISQKFSTWAKCLDTAPVRCWDLSCAASSGECPCPPTHTYKCGDICVEDTSTCALFQNSIRDACPSHLAYSCGGFPSACRGFSTGNCPSISICPSGFVQCPGALCVPHTEGFVCPATELCDNATAVTGHTLPFRCHIPGRGGECVANPDECPTSLTCPPGYLSCLDLYCVDSETHCVPPMAYFDDCEYVCFDGTCAHNSSECPSRPTCTFGYIRCESGDCVTVIEACPATDAVSAMSEISASKALEMYITRSAYADVDVSNGYLDIGINSAVLRGVGCPSGFVMCSDGSCERTYHNCPEHSAHHSILEIESLGSHFVCPPEKPTLCHDGTCAASSLDCDPALLRRCEEAERYSCPDGSCVTSFKDCPSLVQCPEEFPVYCKTDGSCRKSPDECLISSELLLKSGLFRCPDGSLAEAFGLCGKPVSCGENRSVLCWSGHCADSLENCPAVTDATICRSDSAFPVTCGNRGGSCSIHSEECPSLSKCTKNEPIKCEDGTCRASKAECPNTNSCIDGTYYCAEGVCVSHPELCGTEVTCNSEYPLRCKDGTCRRSEEDCGYPLDYQCPGENAYLCHDLVCVSSVKECPLFPSRCYSSASVLCPDYTCENSSAQCLTHKTTQPEDILCPPWMSKRCPSGECKSTSEPCEDMGTCPTESPYACETSGYCATRVEGCINVNGCDLISNEVKCFGICQSVQDVCEPVGCPLLDGKPQERCDDGSCRLNISNCSEVSPSGCPTNTPYPCLGGVGCAVLASDCDFVCPKTSPYKCYDGYCASSSATCPPFPRNYQSAICTNPVAPILCADGSCTKYYTECPIIAPCGSEYPIRCLDGSCRGNKTALNESKCPTEEVVRYRCPWFNTTHRMHLCQSGECVPNSTFCAEKSTGCPEFAPFRNADGSCTDAPAGGSLATSLGCIDGENVLKCWNGQCVKAYNECLSIQGCPYSHPIRCLHSGECVSSLDECSPSSTCNMMLCPTTKQCVADWLECATSRFCPRNKPYRNLHGDCVSNGQSSPIAEAFDRIRCTSESPYKCADGRCVATLRECVSHSKYGLAANISAICPISARFSCPTTGDCVSDLFECFLGQDLVCQDSLFPFRCISGECVHKPSDCFETASFPSNLILNGTMCGDGSYKSENHGAVCPPIKSCPADRPTLCLDGSCVITMTQCPFISSPCEDDQELCSDGLCYSAGECPDFIGCSMSQPIMCKSGLCISPFETCGEDEGSTCVACVRNNRILPIDASVALWENPELPIVSYEKKRLGLLRIPQFAVEARYADPTDLYYRVSVNSVANSQFQDSKAEWKGFDFMRDAISPVISLEFAAADDPAMRFVALNRSATLVFGVAIPPRFDLKLNVCIAEYSEDEKMFKCAEAMMEEQAIATEKFFRSATHVGTVVSVEIKGSGVFAMLGIDTIKEPTIFEIFLSIALQIISIPIVVSFVSANVLLTIAAMYLARRYVFTAAMKRRLTGKGKVQPTAEANFNEVGAIELMHTSPKEIDDDNKDTESSTTGTDKIGGLPDSDAAADQERRDSRRAIHRTTARGRGVNRSLELNDRRMKSISSHRRRRSAMTSEWPRARTVPRRRYSLSAVFTSDTAMEEDQVVKVTGEGVSDDDVAGGGAIYYDGIAAEETSHSDTDLLETPRNPEESNPSDYYSGRRNVETEEYQSSARGTGEVSGGIYRLLDMSSGTESTTNVPVDIREDEGDAAKAVSEEPQEPQEPQEPHERQDPSESSIPYESDESESDYDTDGLLNALTKIESEYPDMWV